MSQRVRGLTTVPVPTTRAGGGQSAPVPGAEPAYVCDAGHRQPYHGGPLRVIGCPELIALRMRCGRTARVEG